MTNAYALTVAPKLFGLEHYLVTMLAFSVLVLALSQGQAQRCQKNSGAVFLQFGTSHKVSKTGSVHGTHESGDVACYESLDAVAVEEGESVGTAIKDATLAECQDACDEEERT